MLDLIIYLLIENFHVQITRVVLIIPVPMAKSTNHVNKKISKQQYDRVLFHL